MVAPLGIARFGHGSTNPVREDTRLIRLDINLITDLELSRSVPPGINFLTNGQIRFFMTRLTTAGDILFDATLLTQRSHVFPCPPPSYAVVQQHDFGFDSLAHVSALGCYLNFNLESNLCPRSPTFKLR